MTTQMRPFTVFMKSTGEIVRSGMCHRDDVPKQTAGQGGTMVIERESNVDTDMVQGGKIVPKPTLPRAIDDAKRMVHGLHVSDILSGFVSGDFVYPSSAVDQTNMTQAALVGGMFHRQKHDDSWETVHLTAEEARVVLQDFVKHRDGKRKAITEDLVKIDNFDNQKALHEFKFGIAEAVNTPKKARLK